jgi:hypothetical protein
MRSRATRRSRSGLEEQTVNEPIVIRRFARLIAVLLLAMISADWTVFASQGNEQKKETTAKTEPSERGLATMRAQGPLVLAAREITKHDANGLGLAGIRQQSDKRTLEVWWKGDPPNEVRNEIARQEKDKGIKIVLGSARYAQRELIRKRFRSSHGQTGS